MKKNKKKGQSLLEFALLLPIIVLMIHILVQTEAAISTAIVNQKYTRNTLQYLMFNHRNFMEWGNFLNLSRGGYMRRFWVAVDNKTRFGQENADNVQPEAPTRAIGINSREYSAQASDDPGVEFGQGLSARYKVRIRATSFTCVPPVAVKNTDLLTEKAMDENTFMNGGTYEFCSTDF